MLAYYLNCYERTGHQSVEGGSPDRHQRGVRRRTTTATGCASIPPVFRVPIPIAATTKRTAHTTSAHTAATNTRVGATEALAADEGCDCYDERGERADGHAERGRQPSFARGASGREVRPDEAGSDNCDKYGWGPCGVRVSLPSERLGTTGGGGGGERRRRGRR